jgi:putative colanic acid biosynthesis UDP-glucose lipid carrier transferase
MISSNVRPIPSAAPGLLIAIDVVIICALFSLTQQLNLPVSTDLVPTAQVASSDWKFPFFTSLIFVIAGECLGVFRTGKPRQVDSEVLLIAVTWGLSWALASSLVRTIDILGPAPANYALVLWFLLALLLILLNHLILRGIATWIDERGWIQRRCAVLGSTEIVNQLAKAASNNNEVNLNLVGIYRTDCPSSVLPDHPTEQQVFNDLLRAIETENLDTVFIAEPMENSLRIRNWIDRLADTTASVYLVPNLEAFDVLYTRWGNIGGHTVVSVFETPIFGINGYIKRSMDILLSVIGLVIAAPILLLIAVMIRCTSAGPIFFRQRRYGLDGKEFLVWKFRTMSTMENGSIVRQATKNDPRVTPVGRILRRTSLDELPQLLNVLAGSMSLVGPRPYATAHNEQFRSLIRGYMLRHKVRPGITGLAQVLGSRLETDTTEKMAARIELDHRYIREWSLWLDIKIIAKTVAVVLRQQAN